MTREEKKLLRLIKHHPEEGIRQAIELYGNAIKTICAGILREYGNEDIEDAMEECFIRIWQMSRTHTGKIKNLQSYVYQMARNSAKDILRQKARQRTCSMEALAEQEYAVEVQAPEDTEGAVFGKMAKEEWVRQLSAFEEPDKSIFLMRFLYEYKVREIADITGLAEDNIESRIRRGRKKIQKMIQG